MTRLSRQVVQARREALRARRTAALMSGLAVVAAVGVATYCAEQSGTTETAAAGLRPLRVVDDRGNMLMRLTPTGSSELRVVPPTADPDVSAPQPPDSSLVMPAHAATAHDTPTPPLPAAASGSATPISVTPGTGSPATPPAIQPMGATAPSAAVKMASAPVSPPVPVKTASVPVSPPARVAGTSRAAVAHPATKRSVRRTRRVVQRRWARSGAHRRYAGVRYPRYVWRWSRSAGRYVRLARSR